MKKSQFPTFIISKTEIDSILIDGLRFTIYDLKFKVKKNLFLNINSFPIWFDYKYHFFKRLTKTSFSILRNFFVLSLVGKDEFRLLSQNLALNFWVETQCALSAKIWITSGSSSNFQSRILLMLHFRYVDFALQNISKISGFLGSNNFLKKHKILEFFAEITFWNFTENFRFFAQDEK